MPNHLSDFRMILHHLMEFALGQKVATTVACMGNEQPPLDGKGHRQCGSHADHFWMAGSLLENPRCQLPERPLELFQNVLFFRHLQMEESLERIQQETLDGHDAQGAGHFPGLMPSDPVRNDKQVPPMAAVLGLRLWHTRLVDSGSGKGIGVVIPNVLTYAGSCVVFDAKGEIFEICGKVRAKMGVS